MLETIVVQTETVPVGNDQSFKVHGLTLRDLGFLIKDYYEPLNALMENKLDMDTIPEQYPEFMAKIVALGADDYENWEAVCTLPFMTQLTAFEYVWDLTIPDYDALGKLVNRVKGIIQKLPAR